MQHIQVFANGYLSFRTSFAMWLIMNLMVIAVPRYGAVLMTACGFLLLSTVCGYLGMLPENPLVIHLEGSMLEFHLGWCFWLVLIAGKIYTHNVPRFLVLLLVFFRWNLFIIGRDNNHSRNSIAE